MTAVARLETGLQRILSTPGARGVAAAGVTLLVLAGLLFRLGVAPVTRTAEERCFEVAHHMLETGSWLVPVMDGEARLQKPPLYYWAATAVAAVLGGESRVALRLPSAAAALALLVAVFAWGRSRGGFANGALAASCLLTMMHFWTLGRRGVAEMPLALFTTLALFAFERIYWEGRRDLVPWFFAAVWLAFLAKATAAVLVVGLPIGLRLTLDRSWHRALRRGVLAWAAVCVLACLGWYLAVLLLVPGAPSALRESLLLPVGLTESTGSASHVRPLWYFVPVLLSAGAPAAWLVPLVAWYVAVRRPGARASFPTLAFAALFVAFSLIPMKQKHYMMPLLPLLALSLAPALREAYERHRAGFERALGWLGWGVLAAAAVAALLFGLHFTIAGEGRLAVFLVGGSVLAAGVLAFAAGLNGCPRIFAASVVVLAVLTFGVHLASFDPLRAAFRKGVPEQLPGFDAQHWAAMFERHPALRPIYHAQDWQPPSPREPAQVIGLGGQAERQAVFERPMTAGAGDGSSKSSGIIR